MFFDGEYGWLYLQQFNSMKYRIVLLFILLSGPVAVLAQDTLPNFSVRNVGRNRFIIGWVNNYDLVKQIGIQRSHDSLKNYKTILTVTDPNAVQNGFADTKAPNDHMYYRLFVVLDKGQYFFTAARQPVLDTMSAVRVNVEEPKEKNLPGFNGKRADIFVPSQYVFTNREGYVMLNLPDAAKKKYRVKFFEDNNDFLFELKQISESGLLLDKANFHHAGWFRFELYEGEKLVEKHRFYLDKNF